MELQNKKIQSNPGLPFGLWPFFAFLNVVKNSIFWTKQRKFQTFYEILNFNLVNLTIFLKEIWPF